jgi:aryl-alcohol dehydrogenase-like predicted oxidoreductase
MNISGKATSKGTAAFFARHGHQNFNQTADGLYIANIGHGTYLGEATQTVDEAYGQAFAESVKAGCNLFDLAVNYRFQRSERAFGQWLTAAVENDSLQREEIVICTKGGFVPYDGEAPADPKKWMNAQFLETGLAKPHEFAARYQHCMAPAYLETMIAWSRRNLNVQTIDVYYLHNPETQSIAISHDTFRARTLDALETLEAAVERGHIAAYGIATWNAFRALTNDPAYISLAEMVGMATEVAGQTICVMFSCLIT